MSLEKCPSCKRRISAEAETCPKCGHPLGEGWVERKKKAAKTTKGASLPYFAMVLAVIVGIVVYNCTPKTPNKPGAASTTATTGTDVSSTNSLPQMKDVTPVNNCSNKLVFKDWESQCERIFSYTVLPTVLDGEHPTRLALAYDGNRVSVIGMVPEWYHQKFYTNKMPALAVIDGKTYVANRSWFDEHKPPQVTVGSSTMQDFQWKGNAHWVATEKASEKFIDLFRMGVEAKIKILAYDNQTTTISLRGFSAALDAATESANVTSASQWPSSPALAIAEVAKHLTLNDFKITESTLRAIKNPQGMGYYVYVPQTQFVNSTHERKFIWFVGNGAVMKLNGAAYKLTPDLPWPREVDYRVLNGANLWDFDILDYGLSKAFGK